MINLDVVVIEIECADIQVEELRRNGMIQLAGFIIDDPTWLPVRYFSNF